MEEKLGNNGGRKRKHTEREQRAGKMVRRETRERNKGGNKWRDEKGTKKGERRNGTEDRQGQRGETGRGGGGDEVVEEKKRGGGEKGGRRRKGEGMGEKVMEGKEFGGKGEEEGGEKGRTRGGSKR